MTVFNDRRTASHTELSGSNSSTPGQRNAMLNSFGLSGGELPTRPDAQKQYPLDQTTSVVNMR